MSFVNKVVLITGASSGIGADTARHFSTLGAELVLVGRNVENLQTTADICRNNSGLTPLTVVADITKDEDVERIIDDTKKHFRRLDVLVNNAGIAPMDNILEYKMESFDAVMNTNLRSIFNLTRLALPLLIETKGNVINISSILAVKPSWDMLTTSVCKAALNTFTRTIALQLAPQQVRVNAIVVGLVETNMVAVLGADICQAFIKKMPLGRAVEKEEVSLTIAYLASDAARSITGHYIAVDGGYSSS